MRGRSSTPVQYVCEDDRGLPPEQQTVFWIVCKNHSMANQTASRYIRAQRDVAGGGRDYDSRKLDTADIEDFVAFCSQVDNYAWSEDYLRAHPGIAGKINDQGFYVDPITDPNLLADVVRDLPSSILSEIFDVAGSQVRLDRGAKKGLSSSPGLPSGSPKS